MSKSKPLIRSSAVYERNNSGDLDPGEWVRLWIPGDMVRIVTLEDGREVVELHMYALTALISERQTIDAAKDALNLCRVPGVREGME